MKFKVGDKVIRINSDNDDNGIMKVGTLWEVEGYAGDWVKIKGYKLSVCNEDNFRLITPLEQLL